MEDKVYTKATPLLIELHKNYTGAKKSVCDYSTVFYFDNVDVKGETGYFYACESEDIEYVYADYKELAEQEFIEFMGLGSKQSLGSGNETIQVILGKKESSNKLNYELDFSFITQMAERMQTNKGKYDPYNWKKPINVEDLKQAIFRHVLEIMNGNYEDDGRELGHIEAIACNAMMLNYQIKNNN